MSHGPKYSQVVGRFFIEVFPTQDSDWNFRIEIQSSKELIFQEDGYISSREAWDAAQEEIDHLIMEDKSS